MKLIRGTIQVKSFSVSDINKIKEILNNCGLSEQGEYCKCSADSNKLYRNRSIRYRGLGLELGLEEDDAFSLSHMKYAMFRFT